MTNTADILRPMRPSYLLPDSQLGGAVSVSAAAVSVDAAVSIARRRSTPIASENSGDISDDFGRCGCCC